MWRAQQVSVEDLNGAKRPQAGLLHPRVRLIDMRDAQDSTLLERCKSQVDTILTQVREDHARPRTIVTTDGEERFDWGRKADHAIDGLYSPTPPGSASSRRGAPADSHPGVGRSPRPRDHRRRLPRGRVTAQSLRGRARRRIGRERRRRRLGGRRIRFDRLDRGHPLPAERPRPREDPRAAAHLVARVLPRGVDRRLSLCRRCPSSSPAPRETPGGSG